MWIVSRFYLVPEPKLTEPDFLARRLENYKFDGEKGVIDFGVWREFEESRFKVVEVTEKSLRVRKISPNLELETEVINLEDVILHEFHVKSYGLVEFRSKKGPFGIAEEIIEDLELIPLKFESKDLLRVVKIADAIRGAKFKGKSMLISLRGFSLTEEERFNELLNDSDMELIEIRGRIQIEEIPITFRMDSGKLALFVKTMDEKSEEAVERVIETFVKIR